MLIPLKKFSLVLFTVILICFFLSWLNLTCNSKPYASFSRMELVTGTKVEQKRIFGSSKSKKVEPEPIAVGALVLAIIGIALNFVKKSKFNFASAIVGLAIFIALLILKSKIDSEVTNQGEGMVEASWLLGFWGALIISLVAVSLSGFLYIQNKKEQQSSFTQT